MGVENRKGDFVVYTPEDLAEIFLINQCALKKKRFDSWAPTKIMVIMVIVMERARGN